MEELRCHYSRHTNTFEGIIEHSIQVHAMEGLKIRRKCFCDKTGEQKYQVFNCGLIPNRFNSMCRTLDENNKKNTAV